MRLENKVAVVTGASSGIGRPSPSPSPQRERQQPWTTGAIPEKPRTLSSR